MNFEIILDTLPFSIYWIENKRINIFKGGNKHFLSSLNFSSMSELIDKPTTSIFAGDYLRIVNDLLDKSMKNEGKIFSAVYHKTVNTHDEPTLIQCRTVLLQKNVVIFSETYPKIEDFNQYLWEEKEKLTIYLNNIIENVPASIYWKDINSIILGGSKLHTELTGYVDSKQVIGKTDYDFVWKNQAERIQENDRFVMKNNQLITFEERAKLPDDGMHIFLTQKSPLKGKGDEVIGVLGVSIDITELKETQKKLKRAKLIAEAANQAKTEFIANMSHDIRTPLTGIIGLSQLLEHRLVAMEDKMDLRMMHQASERLLDLLNSVLDVASLETVDEAQLKLKAFSLVDLSQALKNLLSPSAKLKGLSLDVNIDISKSEYVVSDQNKLERILLNLITNAIKFTNNGKITLSIKKLVFFPKKTDGIYVEFIVSDTGIGIPSDKLAYIFDYFFRVNPVFEETNQGYGVGLYIVKKFVNLLGGEVEVKSELGVGTNFSFTLFMALPKGDDAIKKIKNNISDPFIFLKSKEKPTKKKEENLIEQTMVSSEESLQDDLAKKNILLIEDDRLAIKFSKELLAQAGYMVTVVSTFQEALSFAKDHDFNLIITDLGLPEISGNELAVVYRYWERVNNKRPIPIIGLTAHGQGKFKEACFAAGINEIWLKPLTIQKIKKLEKLLLKRKDIASEFDLKLKVDKNELNISEEKNISLGKANLLDIINSYPLFDRKISLQNLSGNEELLKEILEMFKQSIPEQLQELKKGYELKNWEVLENIVHKIKGGACYVGAVRLNYVCQDFLRCYTTGQSQLLDSLYQNLLLILVETQKALDI